jgi:hypothetical protein
MAEQTAQQVRPAVVLYGICHVIMALQERKRVRMSEAVQTKV